MEKEKHIKLNSELLQQRKINRAAFSDIAHRLETVGELNGVEWVNDSKSTDIEAASFSLETIQKPIVWVVGSDESRRNLILVKKLVKYKVLKIVCFGASSPSKEVTPCTDTDTGCPPGRAVPLGRRNRIKVSAPSTAEILRGRMRLLESTILLPTLIMISLVAASAAKLEPRIVTIIWFSWASYPLVGPEFGSIDATMGCP